ncbi:MAG: HlyD family efflux transporter periplasmic adaptor subunit [Clostridia bacterium]|nr:HlyD family efflux transporter periplasmic adaptor subunit [Clostridia bacterium]
MKLKLPKLPEVITQHKKWSIIIAIALILVIVLVFINAFGSKKQTSSNATYSEYTVSKGDISVIISGSGTIKANEQYDITSLVTGDVLSSNFEEGDIVQEGAVLYEIDTESVKNSIEKAKNSVETAKMSYDDALEDVSNLNVKANCSGVITKVYIKDGDSVSKGTKIADVVDDSIMRLKIPFNANDAESLYAGQSITVRLDGSAYELDGKIAKISTGSTSSSVGVSVKTVEIEVNNPGTIKEGEKAIAYTNEYACNESGTFEVNEQRTITADVSGDVSWIAIGVGDKVSKGQKVAELTSKSVLNSAKRSSLSYKDAQLNLDNLYEDMENYTITAPISGTVISKETKAGDKLDNSNKSTVMAVIADMSRMLFEIPVDELDIAKLKTGQEVSVTADALEGKRFSGYIDKISIIGTTSNGVTTYPVTVVVNEPEGLIPGMNVDAEITVQESKGVLSVPISAIMRGNMVAVKSDGKSKQDDNKPQETKDQKGASSHRVFGAELPDGFELKRVEIGISNSDSVEILSGLKEGDIILVQQTNVGAQSLQETMMRSMGAAHRSGGMPSGGMGGGPMGGGSR